MSHLPHSDSFPCTSRTIASAGAPAEREKKHNVSCLFFSEFPLDYTHALTEEEFGESNKDLSYF